MNFFPFKPPSKLFLLQKSGFSNKYFKQKVKPYPKASLAPSIPKLFTSFPVQQAIACTSSYPK